MLTIDKAFINSKHAKMGAIRKLTPIYNVIENSKLHVYYRACAFCFFY